MDYDLIIRLCMIGHIGAGKKSILRRFENPDINIDNVTIPNTIGVDFISKIITINGKRINSINISKLRNFKLITLR